MVEDSIQFLLEAQADCCREMIALNGNRVTESELAQMHEDLAACKRELRSRQGPRLALVACA